MAQALMCLLCFVAGFVCCLILGLFLLSKGTSDIEKNGL